MSAADVERVSGETPVAFLARLALHAARQVPDDGWQDARRPEGARTGSILPAVGKVLLGPVFALGLVAVLTAPWPYRWYVLHTASTAVASGVSTGETSTSGPGPIPADITIRYRDADGAEHTADVATTRPLPKGIPLVVKHAVDKPGWVRLEGRGDGLDRGAALGLVGALIALGWAGRLAVAPDQQRQGIGSALVCTAVAAADARGDQVVVLEGSPRFYGRLGFTYAPDHGITLDLPDWAPREAAQVYLLTSWDATIRGRVEYPPAIADVAR